MGHFENRNLRFPVFGTPIFFVWTPPNRMLEKSTVGWLLAMLNFPRARTVNNTMTEGFDRREMAVFGSVKSKYVRLPNAGSNLKHLNCHCLRVMTRKI
jgi:hypothetical protein